MAATTKLLQLRPKTLPLTTTTATTPAATSVHFFSSSTTPDPDNTPSPQSKPRPPPPQSQPQPQYQSQSPFSFSSYISDVKASLKQQQQQPQQSQWNPQSQPRRKPFSFASPVSKQSDQIEEIRKNLLEFRRRSAPPPPTPPPPPSSTSSTTSAPNSSRSISFQELYQRGLASKGQESAPGASEAVVKDSFRTIRDSLNQLKPSSTNQSQGGGRTNNAMPISRWKESLTTRPLDPSLPSLHQRGIEGSDHLPPSIFRREMNEVDAEDGTQFQTEFVRIYSTRELGEKLRALRPERRDKKDWFSLEELSERLVKLRKMEEEEINSKPAGATWMTLRKSLQAISETQSEPKKHNIAILGQLPPLYMSSPPKEELVEKYFHPDHMSAAEKLKLELKKVRDKFKLSESDCGSARVQVAQLTTKIKHLSTVLHKKDKHSRKGLEEMVQRRKKLLKYLRRTDWDSYCFVLSKLGLRDSQDDYAKKKNYPSKKDHSGKKKALKN
ncbi:golgin subfamily A member 2 [Coffea eugenioides]|uniref:golgin subfamily A member 2 n=1 Tax=Coffea eugenioides TaxID=49369 RepID=UPI000F6151FF|nr:golgin subfamily A member 2 [Coffea eugenioides]